MNNRVELITRAAIEKGLTKPTDVRVDIEAFIGATELSRQTAYNALNESSQLDLKTLWRLSQRLSVPFEELAQAEAVLYRQRQDAKAA